MTITKLILTLVCLMAVTMAARMEPKEAKVTTLLSKDLTLTLYPRKFTNML